MLFRLECGYQKYDWGKLGDSSLVAKFAATSDGTEITPSDPYAELWMGSHPKLPSKIVGEGSDGSNLRQICDQYPKILGLDVAKKFGPGELPFLFKVLSIRKALSIQAHPDKQLGQILFDRDPKNYPDNNHKPEMAIALTDFEGFCGFRPVDEISGFLTTIPEFFELVGPEVAQKFNDLKSNTPKQALKTLFGAVMNASDEKVGELADKLAKRAACEGSKFGGGELKGAGKPLAELIVRVNEQFPRDVGLFCGGLMLNYVTLKKGEAMFLRAKDPHAYISGDIIECMAASDNVVRAGFTPKFKDVSTLVEMLTYECAPVEEQKMTAQPFDKVNGGVSKLFDPPIEEFSVVQQTTTTTAKFSELNAASVFIITEGQGKIIVENKELTYTEGYVFFVGAGTAFEIKATKPTVSYHAITEV